MSIFTRLRNDQRGWAVVQVAALIIAPIVMFAVLSASLMAQRTGAGITEGLQRAAIVQATAQDLKGTIGSASTVTVNGATTVSASMTPAQLPAAALANPGSTGEVCITSVWQLVPEGSLTTLLRQVHTRESSDCGSAVVGTVETRLTGFAPGVTFQYTNRAGRTLTASGSTLIAGSGTRPTGVPNSFWNSTELGSVKLVGTVQNLIGNAPVVVTSYLP